MAHRIKPSNALVSSSVRIAAIGSVLAAVSLASAQINSIYRSNVEEITFSDSNSFSDASFTGDIFQYWSGAQGAYTADNWGAPSGFSLLYDNGDANVGISDVTTTNTGVFSTVTMLTGQDGWTDLGISEAVNVDPPFLGTTVSNGLWALDLNQNSYGGVVTGDPFYWSVTFSGDWSVQGTSTGESELLSYNPEFTIVDDFVYDSNTNTTLFAIYDPAYDNVNGTGVSIQLNGGAAPTVPGPVALAPFSMGLLGLVRRRNRRS